MTATALKRKTDRAHGPDPGIEVDGSEGEDVARCPDNGVDCERWSGDVTKQQRELRKLFIGIGILLAALVPIALWIGYRASHAMHL